MATFHQRHTVIISNFEFAIIDQYHLLIALLGLTAMRHKSKRTPQIFDIFRILFVAMTFSRFDRQSEQVDLLEIFILFHELLEIVPCAVSHAT